MQNPCLGTNKAVFCGMQYIIHKSYQLNDPDTLRNCNIIKTRGETALKSTGYR